MMMLVVGAGKRGFNTVLLPTPTTIIHQPAPTGISQSKAKRVQEYVVAGRCLLMWLVSRAHTYTPNPL